MKRFLKEHCFNIIMMIIFLLGIAIVAYPTVSDYWNSKVQSRAISDYRNTVDRTDNSELERMKTAAILYNQALYSSQQSGKPVPEGTADYEDVLNINKDGIMGYLVIPTIDVELPIYHGTEDSILRVASGHSPASSVPVGGVNTHAVILGHRGLPSARLFNDLDQLEKGDYFEIHILNDMLCYEVSDIKIVEPRELARLRIIGGEDVITLVTCTPYGINTHRLLVQGKRVETTEVDLLIYSEARRINKAYVAIAVGIVLWTLSMIVLLYVSSKYKTRRLSREEYLRRREILDKYMNTGPQK